MMRWLDAYIDLSFVRNALVRLVVCISPCVLDSSNWARWRDPALKPFLHAAALVLRKLLDLPQPVSQHLALLAAGFRIFFPPLFSLSTALIPFSAMLIIIHYVGNNNNRYVYTTYSLGIVVSLEGSCYEQQKTSSFFILSPPLLRLVKDLPLYIQYIKKICYIARLVYIFYMSDMVLPFSLLSRQNRKTQFSFFLRWRPPAETPRSRRRFVFTRRRLVRSFFLYTLSTSFSPWFIHFVIRPNLASRTFIFSYKLTYIQVFYNGIAPSNTLYIYI